MYNTFTLQWKKISVTVFVLWCIHIFITFLNYPEFTQVNSWSDSIQKGLTQSQSVQTLFSFSVCWWRVNIFDCAQQKRNGYSVWMQSGNMSSINIYCSKFTFFTVICCYTTGSAISYTAYIFPDKWVNGFFHQCYLPIAVLNTLLCTTLSCYSRCDEKVITKS